MSTTPPRKFAVEPVETSSSKKPRRFAPEPVESTTRARRKFHPEPIETSTRHSQGDAAAEDNNEHSQGTNAKSGSERRRFTPEPIETISHHHHRRKEVKEQNSDEDEDAAPLLPHERIRPIKKSAPRKFAPQLIETAKRTRRHGDTGPTMLPHDKTNVSPDDAVKSSHKRPDPSPLPPANTPVTSSLQVPLLKPTPNRQGSLHPHYPTRNNTRSHSFKVPELDSIDSSESDESDAPSVALSNVSETSSDSYKHATRMRESVDEKVSGYLLALAARAAEKQLRDQAAAAFPNSDIHEPVAHFINRSDSEMEVSEPAVTNKGDVVRSRRDSGDEKLALLDMQRHAERVQRDARKTRGFDVEFNSDPMHQDAWIISTVGNPWTAMGAPKSLIGGQERETDIKQMRKAARPPMLGGSIDFPRCASPEFARFDVTQGADFLRKSMGYGNEGSETSSHLWNQRRKTRHASPSPAPTPTSTTAKKKKSGGGGLWGGHCTAKDAKPVPMPANLLTPLRTPLRTPNVSPTGVRKSVLSELPTVPNKTPSGQAPPSPPSSSSGSMKDSTLCALDARLQLEAKIEEDFSDSFVTQVYNYLSLGYPSLARKFDEELSRISFVSIEELRMDDALAHNTRGYIRLGDDAPGNYGVVVEEEMCQRWKALKIYVREWGKQMLTKEKEGQVINPMRAWGMPIRRGSWGN